MKALLVGLKNILLWSYARGSWQYDVLCVLIVAVLFLVPASFFGDRDRADHSRRAQANEIPAPASNAASPAYNQTELLRREISASELRAFLRAQQQPEELLNSPQEAIVLYLQQQFQREATLIRYETFSKEAGHAGYRAFFQLK